MYPVHFIHPGFSPEPTQLLIIFCALENGTSGAKVSFNVVKNVL